MGTVRKSVTRHFFYNNENNQINGLLIINQKITETNSRNRQCLRQSKNRKKKQNEKKNLSQRLKSVILNCEK